MPCPKCSKELTDENNCPTCGPLQSAQAGGAVNPPAAPPQAGASGEAPATNPTTGSPPAGQTTTNPPPAAGATNEGHLINDKTVAIHRDQIAQQVINNYGGKFEKQTIEEALFSAIIEDLPPRLATTCEFDPKDLDSILDNLRQRHLILISCPYMDYALDAAYTLIERLALSNGDQKFRIDLQQQLIKYTISSASFLPDNQSVSGKVAVLVNARDADAQRELDKLISDADRAGSFEWKLQQRDVYLLCIVQPSYIEERLGDASRELKSLHWKIPFLVPLLKMYFSPEECVEMEQLIHRYNEKHRWPNESACYSEIMTAVKSRELRTRLEEWDRPLDISARDIFADGDYMAKSVLYLATYFRDLSPKEFSHMVEVLLGERKVTVAVPEYRKNADKNHDRVYTTTETPIVEIWRDERDDVMWKWLRETYSAKDSVKVVDFCDYRLRDDLKRLLESERNFYVKGQFKKLHHHGFLFYNSDRVAENMIRLTCEMITEYPDEFNKEWLFEITAAIKSCFDPECDLDAQPGATVIQSLKKMNPGALNLAYSRIADLMRLLLKDPQTRVLVDGCLDDLLRSGHHDTLIQLIRRLRAASEIDDLYWIKRLLDNGNRGAQLKAYDYLYGYVRRLGIGILEQGNVLEKWIPKEERQVENYPRSSHYALRSIVQYCLETIAEFDAPAYGVWPSSYPLFAFTDAKAAETGLHQLMQWLFHPAQEKVLQQLNTDIGVEGDLASPNRLIGALIAEWYFILLGPPEKALVAANPDNRSEAGKEADAIIKTDDAQTGLDATTLSNILLKQVTQVADKDQQKELFDYWEKFRRDLRELILMAKLSSDLRPQLIWRNNRLWELIKTAKSLA